MTEQWRELKETITEMRDNDGTGTQQEVCKFLADYMEVLEKQMQQPCEDAVSREAVKALIKRLSFKYYMECGEYIGEDSREVTLINALKFEECFEDLPSVTPQTVTEFADKCKECGKMLNDKLRMNLAETSQDCISRQKALDCFEQTNTRQGAKYAIETLPSVTPERPNLDMIKQIRRMNNEDR